MSKNPGGQAPDGSLYVTPTDGAGGLGMNHATTGIADGHKEVTTAGTPVALMATSTLAKWVIVQAYRSNTGYIAVGGSSVSASATAGTGTGASLAAGESVTLPIADLATVHIDATVNGEGVRFTYGT